MKNVIRCGSSALCIEVWWKVSLAAGYRTTLQLRHNERDGVSKHQPHNCYPSFYSDADQRKHQRSASLASVRGIHREPVNSPHKGPVTRKIFHFMRLSWYITWWYNASWILSLLFSIDKWKQQGPGTNLIYKRLHDDACMHQRFESSVVSSEGISHFPMGCFSSWDRAFIWTYVTTIVRISVTDS